MSAGLLHQNSSIFQSPSQFQPERWLDTPSLNRYLFLFSKGSRQCIGINLAYSKLYICLSTVLSRYSANGPARMVLYKTNKTDVG
jgi:cytochrome P450